MARIFSMNVPTSVAAGTATECASLREKYVQIAGTFSATLQLQGSMDGSNWSNIGSSQTGAALVSAAESVVFLRMNVTAYTSGTPTAILLGHEER